MMLNSSFRAVIYNSAVFSNSIGRLVNPASISVTVVRLLSSEGKPGEAKKDEPKKLKSLKDIVHPNTPLGMLDRVPKTDKSAKNESQTPKPFDPFPDSTNPVSGEVGGPAGPEPTRFGDWERKGRVSDF